MKVVFLLAEIMRGGNFGQFDTRLGSKENEGKLHRYLRMSLRNLRFVKHLSYRGIERTFVQNLVCFMEEDTWNKIIDLRANGSSLSFIELLFGAGA